METTRIITKECMETGKRVQILLSTYNGAEYLREQLDSYIAQSFFEHCSVLIRDDGSTDATIDILHEYERQYGFQVVSGQNIGVNRSYQWLIDHADLNCDYFALSDQDDVWIPNKIERAVKKLDSNEDDFPALFASCSLLTDAELKPIGSSLCPQKGVSFFNAMIQNVCPGHTEVLNRKLLSMMRGQRCEGMLVLDWWVYLLASGIGIVYFENEFTVMHRQHGHNAIGYSDSFLKLLFPRIKRVLSNESRKMSKQLESFCQLYGQYLSTERKNELDAFLYSRSGFSQRIKYINQCRVFRQTKLETFLFYGLYLMGKYCTGR